MSKKIQIELNLDEAEKLLNLLDEVGAESEDLESCIALHTIELLHRAIELTRK